MKRARLTLLVVATAAVFAVPAAAQQSDQALIDEVFAPFGDKENIKHLDYTARCVAEKYPLASDAFVRNSSDSTALFKDQDRLLDSKCLKEYFFRSSSTTYDPGTYQVILVEALLKLAQADLSLSVQFDNVASPDQPRLPDVPISQVHPFYRSVFVIDKLEAQLSQFAECAARSRPDAVLALAATKRDSAEETAVLTDIESSPAECAAKRPTVSFPAFARRGELMLQLYLLSRLSGAPAPKPMPKGRR